MILVMQMPYRQLWRAWLTKVHLIWQLCRFGYNGASVMLGKKNGVAAKLKADNPTLVNIHCVCHKLALACTDTVAELKFIKQVETTLRQLWQWLENSPKRMAAFLKIQVNLQKSKALSDKHLKLITRRLKKACSTRWLSFEKSVSAAKSQYEAILHTLSEFAETDSAALGLQKMLTQVKFLGALYILHEVLPKLSQLSLIFQQGQIIFSAIAQNVKCVIADLTTLKTESKALDALEKDIDSLEFIFEKMKLGQKQIGEMLRLQQMYLDRLISNIEQRFDNVSFDGVLVAFSAFDPTGIPVTSNAQFHAHGQESMSLLANHYFQNDENKAAKLKAEYQMLKFYISEHVTVPDSAFLKENNLTPLTWFLQTMVLNPIKYDRFFQLSFCWQPRLLSFPAAMHGLSEEAVHWSSLRPVSGVPWKRTCSMHCCMSSSMALTHQNPKLWYRELCNCGWKPRKGVSCHPLCQ